MTPVDAVSSFAQTLNVEIREQATEGTPFGTEVECFASRVLEMFEDAGVLEDAEVCVRGGRIGRSNWELAGWAAPPSGDEDLSTLSVLAVLFNDSPEPAAVSGSDLRHRFELVEHFVRDMLSGKAIELEPAADVASFGRLIYDRRNVLTKIIVHIATDGLTQRLRQIDSVSLGSVELACSIWDIERLSRLSDPRQEEIDVNVKDLLGGRGLPCLFVPEEDPDYDAYLCVVPGSLLYKTYEQYGQRLLELNVRAFLSAKGRVNRGIRETIHGCPDRFFPYNNGLAMTARSVEIGKTPDGHPEIVRIVGLQIVNGGQTTVSIHRAWKMDGEQANVEKVFVQGKLVVITTRDDDTDGFVDLVRSISRFANSQNAIKSDDLEANQPWHIAFERLSRETWAPDRQSQWYYERARGSYATAKMRTATTRSKVIEFERRWPRSQLVTKTDLAKSMNAWAQHPEIVSRGGQKNFLYFMASLDNQLQQPSLDPEEFRRTIGRVILFRETGKLLHGLRESIPAYRANVTAYLVAYLSFRMPQGLDFDGIWEKQALPVGVTDALQSWAEPIYQSIVASAGSRNIGEWCKKPDCWEVVRALDLELPADLQRSAARDWRGQVRAEVSVGDAKEIAECLRVTPDEWEQILHWLVREHAPSWQQGIVQTMRLYSLDGWARRPTAKQARWAIKSAREWRQARDAALSQSSPDGKLE